MTESLLKVRDLKKHFPVRGGILSKPVGWVQAVDGISFSISQGETLGLVGESGCGKSTTGLLILRLLEATTGEVCLEGEDILKMEGRRLRKARKHLQMIFQDPFSSLDPKKRVEKIVAEGLEIHGEGNGSEKRDRVADILKRVGLSHDHMTRYPHEFSGGQRQRIGIARALVLSPKLVVADEPVSALDVSVQAQVINLLEDLQEDFGLSYLLIAHDLGVVQHISDRNAVMYLGKIVEMASSSDLYNDPLHPYTVALLSAIPTIDQSQKKSQIILKGDVPSPLNPPEGCLFHPRCYRIMEVCKTEKPQLRMIKPDHPVACHLY
ncbi:MAG: dipeptide ABC transporter ATP-binding protein [Candidatus Binatia bacterium]|jgi:oligopeptide transport system ATP-binding protein|nr:dipeptide ABC transporter ATP-binding protein [Candidatus Binatia bacterium]